MVRSISQTTSGRALVHLGMSSSIPYARRSTFMFSLLAGRANGSPKGQPSSIADRLLAGSAVPPEWHITSSPFSSPSSSPSSYTSSPASSTSSPYTSASSPSPSTASRASSPATSRTSSPLPHKTRSSCSRRSQKDPTHISRPLNAFIIFRKHKCPQIRAAGVERDNRIISRIVGGIWKKMSEEEKAPYRAEAQRLADAHKVEHPHYRFSPQARSEPKKRRNVKRRDEVTRQRVAAIAQAVLEGASMKEAADEFDALNAQEPAIGLGKDPSDQYTTAVFDVKAWVPPRRPSLEVVIPVEVPTPGEETPFRSPLLPPCSLESLADLANLSLSDGSSPLTPLDLTDKPIQVCSSLRHYLLSRVSMAHQHAPVLHAVPLPMVNIDGVELAYPPTPAYDYIPQPQVPAYAIHPSQPQGALALEDTYDVDTAPSTFATVSVQDVYAHSYSQMFSHDCQEYVAPVHQPAFVMAQHIPSPDVAAFQSQLNLAFDDHYVIPDASQPVTGVANAWPYVPSTDFPGIQPQNMAAFASQMQGYVAPMESLNAWSAASYAQNYQTALQNWA